MNSDGKGSRGGVFYGWWVVGASGVGLSLCLATTVIFTFQVFVMPLEAAFGWSRTQISMGLSITTVTAALASPLGGLLMDRHGVRRVLLPSIGVFGILIGTLYFATSSLWHFYAVFLMIATVGAVVSPLAYSRVIVNWFDRRRGLALGVGLAGVGIGAAVVPSLAQYVISNYGWREAYVALALLILAVSLPIVAVILKEAPEQMGLRPDGDGGPQAASGITAREAVHTRSFWLMAVSFFLIGFVVNGVIAHLVPMLIDRGMAPARAAGAASTFGVALLSGRVLAGYLMDRFFAPHVALAFFLGPVAGISLLAMGAVDGMAVASAGLVGLALGAEFDVIAFFTSRYFGRLSFGQIYGYLFGAFLIGGGGGPIVMGMAHDSAGSYAIGLWLLAALMLTVCGLIGLLGPYPDHKIPNQT